MRDEAIDVDPEVRRHLRDVRDHVLQVTERLAGFRELLQSILSVNLTLASLAQNEQVKKISAWAAILFAPTLIGTIYGMNFDYMPELGWPLGCLRSPQCSWLSLPHALPHLPRPWRLDVVHLRK